MTRNGKIARLTDRMALVPAANMALEMQRLQSVSDGKEKTRGVARTAHQPAGSQKGSSFMPSPPALRGAPVQASTSQYK